MLWLGRISARRIWVRHPRYLDPPAADLTMALKTLLLALTAVLALATSASAFSGEGTAYAGARPQHTKPSTPSRLTRHSRPASLTFAQLTRYLRHAPLQSPAPRAWAHAAWATWAFTRPTLRP